MKKQLFAIALGALAAQTAASQVLILDTFDSANSDSINAGATLDRLSGTLADEVVNVLPQSYGGFASNNSFTTINNNTLRSRHTASTGVINQLADLRAAITDTNTEEFTLSTDLSFEGPDSSWTSFYLTTHNGDERAASRMGFRIFGTGDLEVYHATNTGARTAATIQPATLTADLGSVWGDTTSRLYEFVATPSSTPTTSSAGTFTLKIDGVEITGATDLNYSLGPGNDGFSAPNYYNLGSISLGVSPGLIAIYDNWQAAINPELSGIAGDYNGDEVVDAADYTIWRDSLNSVGADLAADGDGDMDVDADDYLVWRNAYLASSGNDSGGDDGGGGDDGDGGIFPGPVSIPEPCGAAIALVALGLTMTGRNVRLSVTR
ncbi:MAG: hypothetical protein AAGB00_09100 [Planctomycetota bacterium]